MKQNRLSIGCLVAVLCFVPSEASAERPKNFEETVKKLDIRFEPAQAKAGETVTLKITIDPIDGWHTYPAVQPDARSKNQSNRIFFPDVGPVVFVGTFDDPPNPKSKIEPANMNGTLLYYEGSVTWERKAVVSPLAKPGEISVVLNSPKGLTTRFMVCDEMNCFNSKGAITLKLDILPGGPVPIDPKYKEEVEKALAATPELKKDTTPSAKKDVPDPKENAEEVKSVGLQIQSDRDYAADIETLKKIIPKVETKNDGFVAFVLTAMFWGIVTLLTPCVFPMVPITVSYFLKQGEKKLHNPLTMATVYTLTIIIVLGVAALFFLAAFQRWAVNPWMNAALGILFVVFALSLFGMFDLVLPNFLVRFTSSREGKGGYGGVVFMALSFSIVSFTCVAPFLGGFAGMAASGNFSGVQLLIGSLAFAGAFAAPFFLLAMFPTLLKKMPKSGGWMNTIKVVMGFLELAAALKFFRTAELRWTVPPELFTYDFVLSMWVVILFLTGLYLLNFFRLPHDEPQEHIGVPRMLIGFMSISVGIYLLPALFAVGNHEKQRPSGTIYAWVDAFLLPEPSNAEVLGSGELAWSADLLASIEDAREKRQNVFVDFTGVTCTNCKLNEQNVFPKPAVKDLLKKFRLVQMYTDEIPSPYYVRPPDRAQREAHAILNQDFQRECLGTTQLPLYVLLKPKPGARGGPVEVLGVYKEGKINNETEFIEFLKKEEK